MSTAAALLAFSILCALGAVACTYMDRRTRVESPCPHANSVAVYLLTGEQCASWCPDCERRFYWLPFIHPRR